MQKLGSFFVLAVFAGVMLPSAHSQLGTTQVSLPATTSKALDGQICGVAMNADWLGGDLGSVSNVGSSDQCCFLCRTYALNNVSCRAWTWVPSTQSCFFKNGTGLYSVK